MLLPSAAALAVPALGLAASGGAGITGNPPSRVLRNSATGVVQPGDVTVTASGNGITIATQASALLRNQLRFTGSVPSRDAGRTVVIERLGHETHWAWEPTIQAIVGHDGSFTSVWHTNHIGEFDIRAVISGGARAASASSPTVMVTVFRPSIATQYGPGFWGSQTACGEILHRNTLGVANRTLPCGTRVAVYYGGRTIVVPVIDRGPYANNADWDLTEATAKALRIGGTATIGAVSLPRR
jgi:peptidoglycan lytic transglycosylase